MAAGFVLAVVVKEWFGFLGGWTETEHLERDGHRLLYIIAEVPSPKGSLINTCSWV